MPSRLYDFAFRALLAEEALDVAGRTLSATPIAEEEVARLVGVDVLDDELVSAARAMAIVYTTISAFEISVRRLVSKTLRDEKGQNWWQDCVSDRTQQAVSTRMADEEKVRWHSKRGTEPVNFTTLKELSNIIRTNIGVFEPFVVSAEWSSAILETIERSRNVIMHGGQLSTTDIARVGTNIRDWVAQVGA